MSAARLLAVAISDWPLACFNGQNPPVFWAAGTIDLADGPCGWFAGGLHRLVSLLGTYWWTAHCLADGVDCFQLQLLISPLELLFLFHLPQQLLVQSDFARLETFA